MPRNTGGRRAGVGSVGFKPGGNSMLNYKGHSDIDALDLIVHRNMTVAGSASIGNLHADTISATNINATTLKLPVSTGNPSGIPEKAGLILVGNDGTNDKLYISIPDGASFQWIGITLA